MAEEATEAIVEVAVVRVSPVAAQLKAAPWGGHHHTAEPAVARAILERVRLRADLWEATVLPVKPLVEA